jgi:hypothetical protein
MTEYAEILAHDHELPLERRYTTYEWKGKPSAPVIIGRWMEVKDLPWKLRLIEKEPYWDAGIYARTDGYLLLFAWLTAARYALRKAWQWVSYRLILTAMVWGLAYTPPWETPSWRDIGRKRTHV